MSDVLAVHDSADRFQRSPDESIARRVDGQLVEAAGDQAAASGTGDRHVVGVGGTPPDHRVGCSPVGPPPAGSARLRVTFSAAHSEADIAALLGALKELA